MNETREYFEGAIKKEYKSTEIRPQTVDYIKRKEKESKGIQVNDSLFLMATCFVSIVLAVITTSNL